MEIRNSRGAGGAKCKGVAGEEEEDTATALRTACCHCCLAFTAIEKGRGAERRVAADHTHPHTHTHSSSSSGAERRSVALQKSQRQLASGWGGGEGGGGSSSSAASHMLYVARDNVRGRGCRTRAKTERFLGAFVRSTGGVACAAIAVMSGSAFFFFSSSARIFREEHMRHSGRIQSRSSRWWMDGWMDRPDRLAGSTSCF